MNVNIPHSNGHRADCLPVIAFVIACGVLGLGWSPLASAEFVSAFANSSLDGSKPIQAADYEFFASSIAEVNGVIRADKRYRLSVTGEQRLYAIEPGYSTEQVFLHYRAALTDAGAQIIYTCAGRDCGLSSLWATDVFAETQLYGVERSQRYLLTARRDENDRILLSQIYLSERGNRRVYAMVRDLAVAAGTQVPGLKLAARTRLGPVILPWRGGVSTVLALSAEQRRTLLEWRDQYPNGHWFLLSFSEIKPDGTDATDDIQTALQQADTARLAATDLLEKLGVPGKRVHAASLGPAMLFSAPERQGNRIEILLIKGSDDQVSADQASSEKRSDRP